LFFSALPYDRGSVRGGGLTGISHTPIG